MLLIVSSFSSSSVQPAAAFVAMVQRTWTDTPAAAASLGIDGTVGVRVLLQGKSTSILLPLCSIIECNYLFLVLFSLTNIYLLFMFQDGAGQLLLLRTHTCWAELQGAEGCVYRFAGCRIVGSHAMKRLLACVKTLKTFLLANACDKSYTHTSSHEHNMYTCHITACRAGSENYVLITVLHEHIQASDC